MFSDILKLFETSEGKIVISIIWGLGLACLFRKVCIGRNCIVYKAPDPKTVEDNIYKFDGKCYQYEPEPTKCNKQPVETLH